MRSDRLLSSSGIKGSGRPTRGFQRRCLSQTPIAFNQGLWKGLSSGAGQKETAALMACGSLWAGGPGVFLRVTHVQGIEFIRNEFLLPLTYSLESVCWTKGFLCLGRSFPLLLSVLCRAMLAVFSMFMSQINQVGKTQCKYWVTEMCCASQGVLLPFPAVWWWSQICCCLQGWYELFGFHHQHDALGQQRGGWQEHYSSSCPLYLWCMPCTGLSPCFCGRKWAFFIIITMRESFFLLTCPNKISVGWRNV